MSGKCHNPSYIQIRMNLVTDSIKKKTNKWILTTEMGDLKSKKEIIRNQFLLITITMVVEN